MKLIYPEKFIVKNITINAGNKLTVGNLTGTIYIYNTNKNRLWDREIDPPQDNYFNWWRGRNEINIS